MTTVHVARIERRIPHGPVPDRFPTHVLVLADDPGGRELPIWLLGEDSHRFADDRRQPGSDELTDRLLRAAGTRVTAVNVDELGPEVTVARIELATPDGPEHVTTRLYDGLATAIASGAPIRVADAAMDRLAVPAGTGQDGPVPERTARDLSADRRPRYEPRNLTFATGLDYWALGGSFTETTLQSHWQDYTATATATAGHGSAILSSATAQPEGFAWLVQEIFADDYRGTTITFRGQFSAPGTTGRTGLFLRVMTAPTIRRAVHRAGRPGRPEQPHRHHRERGGLEHARGHRADPRRRRRPSRSASSWPAPAGSTCVTRNCSGPGRLNCRAVSTCWRPLATSAATRLLARPAGKT